MLPLSENSAHFPERSLWLKWLCWEQIHKSVEEFGKSIVSTREKCALFQLCPDKLSPDRQTLRIINSLPMTAIRIKFRKSSHTLVAMLAAMVGLCVAGVAFGQDGSDRFQAPDIKSSETLGGLPFGGDDQQSEQLEDIDGEVVPGGATLTEPSFGEYGPVDGSYQQKSLADQSPRLELPGLEVTGQTQALPNNYRAQTQDPGWLGPDSSVGQNSSRRQVQDSVPPSVRQPRNSGLRIDGMKAIEKANQNFDTKAHEIVRERYPDGKIKIVRTIAQDADGNYYNDGGWLMYDRQQRPIASGTYIRGAMEGDWERVHEPASGELFLQSPFNLYSGPYLSRANFVRNKIDGVWTISDKEGNLIFSITYQDGVRNGLASWFYPGDKKMREATFKDGVPHGIVLQWDQQGKMQRREQFVDGRKVIRKKSTYPNQTVASERVFRDRKLSPQGSDNWWAAKPATFDRDGEEVQHGPVAEWYPNRQPKMTGRYVDGQRDGLFTWWHPSHNKKAEGSFSKGKRVGLWRYWHESGMKRSEGRFEDDRPDGLWREWNEDGRVVDERTLDADDVSAAEEVDAEEVNPEETDSGSNSILEPINPVEQEKSDGFEIELDDLKTDAESADPISNGDPFDENQTSEEPGGVGSLIDNKFEM